MVKLMKFKSYSIELCAWCFNQRELLRNDGEFAACPACSGARAGSKLSAAKAMMAAILALASLAGCGSAPLATLVPTVNPDTLPKNYSAATRRSICGLNFFEFNNEVCYESGGYCPALSNGSYTTTTPTVCTYIVLDGKICEGSACVPGVLQ